MHDLGAWEPPVCRIQGPGRTNTVDAFGRVSSVRMSAPSAVGNDGPARTLSYGYDDNGNRTRVTHSDGQSFGLSV